MDIIVISDIHGDMENILTFLDKIKELKFDVIVAPGDFTDVINVPKGFTQEDIARLIIKEFKNLGKPVIALPGNNDTTEIIKILENEGISLHGKGKIIGDYGFYGYGGAKTPFGTNIEPSEEETETNLEKGFEEIKNSKYKIQVTHAPPFNTRIDLIQAGIHVGSKVVRGFIENKNPIVGISSHIHEARGVDKIGSTFIMNSGRFPEGYFGLINIENGNVNGKILNLNE